MRVICCAACLWLLAWPAQAGTLYKCVDAHGHESYQSLPCASPASTVWTRAYRPEPPTPARRAPEATAPSAHPMPWRYPRTPVRARRPPPDPCERAKARRERVLAKVGLKRTFDLLRQLDDEVYEACR